MRTVNLIEDGRTSSCNLSQLQKLSCAYIIAVYAQEKCYANISTYFLCA